MFRTFDKDNSGKIDFNEFLLAINITSGGQPKEKLEWAFQMYDIDGNGTIEKKEMTEIIKVIFKYLMQIMFVIWKQKKAQRNISPCIKLPILIHSLFSFIITCIKTHNRMELMPRKMLCERLILLYPADAKETYLPKMSKQSIGST